MPERRARWHPLALLRGRRRPRRLFVGPAGVSTLDDRVDDGAGDAADLPQWLQAHPASDLHIVLSGRWVYPLLAREPALARARAADQQAWARGQFLHFHGAAAAAWPLVLEADASTLAVAALHGGDLPGWQADAAARAGSRLASLRPWWTTAPRRVAQALPGWPGSGRAGLLLAEGAHAAWITFEGCRLVALEQRRAAAADSAALAALLADWQQEHGVAAADCALAGFGVAGDGAALAALARVAGDPASPRPQAAWVLP